MLLYNICININIYIYYINDEYVYDIDEHLDDELFNLDINNNIENELFNKKKNKRKINTNINKLKNINDDNYILSLINKSKKK